MTEENHPPGSAARWGPLFGAKARDWSETWEGESGYGTPVYEYVLWKTEVGPSTRLLDCGCGAGRFSRMAAERGAVVAGIDAAQELIEIAAERTPEGDFRVGDIENLPWPDDSFDIVTGMNSFQFADDKTRALTEARRVSRNLIVVVFPSRVGESGLSQVFKPLFPLFSVESLESMKKSGMFALSEPGKLEEALEAANLELRDDEEIETPIGFPSVEVACRAFLGAGPTQLAIQHSGEQAILATLRSAIAPFTDALGSVTLPAWYRAVIAA